MSENDQEVTAGESGDGEAPPRRGHPPFGCTFFLLIAAFFIGVISYGVYRGFQLNKAMVRYTELEEYPIEVQQPSAAAEAELRARLAAFAKDVADKNGATLSLNADDLNHLVAIDPHLKDYRGVFRVAEITDVVVLDASFEVNTWGDEQRYFNGQMLIKPVLEEGWIDGKIQEIETRKEKVPRDVWRELPSYPLMDFFRKSDVVVKTVGVLSNLKCENGSVVATYKSGKR